MLGPDSIVLTETGDSWFNGMKLRLPEGAKFEIQMQYGSIGVVGATLGLALVRNRESRRDRRWFLPVERAEVSTMIRYELRPIIFLINRGYTIEVEITMVPITTSRTGITPAERVQRGEWYGWGRVETEEELAAAIDKAIATMDRA